MAQSAAEVPVHNHQRKFALINGGVVDHAGKVAVTPIADFDLGRTIFNTLEGALPRFVIRTRIAKEVQWHAEPAGDVERRYEALAAERPLPEVKVATDAGMSEFEMRQSQRALEKEQRYADHLALMEIKERMG